MRCECARGLKLVRRQKPGRCLEEYGWLQASGDLLERLASLRVIDGTDVDVTLAVYVL